MRTVVNSDHCTYHFGVRAPGGARAWLGRLCYISTNHPTTKPQSATSAAPERGGVFRCQEEAVSRSQDRGGVEFLGAGDTARECAPAFARAHSSAKFSLAGERCVAREPLTHPDLLQGHRRHRALVTVSDRPPGRAPAAPAGLLPATRSRWTALWRSNLACVWSRETDLAAITRYVLNLDKWLRYEEMVARMPMLKGSKGQLRANPLAGRMDALEGQFVHRGAVRADTGEPHPPGD